MANNHPFMGSALNAVDAKGRVSLYAPFRELIAVRCATYAPGDTTADDKQLFITLPPELDRLIVTDVIGGRQRAATAKADAEALPPEERAKAMLKASRSMGNATPVSFDAAGRLVLPQKLRNRVGIGDFALQWGGFDHIEFWDPARARHAFRDEPEFVAAIEDLMEERGIAW